jgi:Tol biopolymer transport system component
VALPRQAQFASVASFLTARLMVAVTAVSCIGAGPAGAAEPELVSRQSPSRGGALAEGSSLDASISGDGQLVAFTSGAHNLSDEASDVNVFTHDRRTRETTLVSTVQWPASSESAITADGRSLVFVAGPDELAKDGAVYIRDLRTGSLTVVGSTSTHLGYAYPQAPPVVSGTGRIVVFETNERKSLRMFDRRTGKTRTVARVPQGGYFSGLSISLAGSVIGYTELRDTPKGDDQVSTYRYDLKRKRRQLLARYVTECCHIGYGIYGTTLSEDGSRMAYISNRADEPRDLYSTLYLWDSRTGRRRSLGRGQDPNIDADGRYVTFTRSPAEGDAKILLHDQKRGTTRTLVTGDQPRLSADGRWIAYDSVTPDPHQVAVIPRP